MQNLRSEIDACWQDFLLKHPFWKTWEESSPGSASLVKRTLLAPGKRLRPMVFMLACQAFGRDPRPGLIPAALALELAHNFILIHDDVMDRSDLRRGVPTLTRLLDQSFDGESTGGFRGSDLALVAGDLLYSMAIESLMRTDVPAPRLVAAMREFMRAALETGRGALLEVRAAGTRLADLNLESIEHLYALKTGCYSFELPMRLAVLFSEGPETFPFRDFGVHAGIAFQLQNDRKALSVWLNGGEIPDDVRDRRHIWAMVRSWQDASEHKRPLFDSPPGDALKECYRSSGTLVSMDRAIAQHASVAVQMVPEGSLRSLLQETLGIGIPTAELPG